MPTHPQPPIQGPKGPVATEPGVRLGTMLDDLLWPRLFESAGLALRPERLIFALITIILLGLLGSSNLMWAGGGGKTGGGEMGGGEAFLPLVSGRVWAEVSSIWAGLWSWDLSAVRFGLERLLTDVPHQIFAEHTVSVLVLGPLLVLVWGVGGVAVCRSGACEFALGLALPWPRTLAFSLERWRTVLAAFFGPWLVIGMFAFIVWVFGWLMGLDWLWGGVGLISAVLFGLVLFVAAGAVVLMLGYVLGLVLIAPAIACEGTDAIDALQRTYARVLGKPFRLLLYLLIAAGIGFVAIGAVSLFMDALRGFVVEIVGVGVVFGEEGAGGGAVSTVLGMWLNVLSLLAAAYALSYFHTAATAVYLILRQTADGQDIADLWMPGLVEGTMTESLAARGEVAKTKSA